jgi:hypothetical protein
MGNQIPGPICGSQVGPEWIDSGTMCRTKSSPPGPTGAGTGSIAIGNALGPISSPALGALPRPRPCPGPANIEKGIKVLREESPLRDVDYGQRILELLVLYEKQKGRAYRDGIRYGKVEGARGDWYGTGITISEEFCESIEGTILELVHEASHARFAQTNPLQDRSKESIIQNATDSELYAVINQIDIYKWLKERNPLFTDQRMEQRIVLLESGKLRPAIEGEERKARTPHGVEPETTPRVVEPPPKKAPPKQRSGALPSD